MENPLPPRRKDEAAKAGVDAAVEERAASVNTFEDKAVVANGPSIVDTATAPSTEAVHYVTGWKLWSMLVSLASVFILVLLDMSIVATPLTGKVYSLFNTKWTFICFFGLFEFGSLICGVATSSTMLIIGRAVAGMGGSGLINGGMQIIYQSVPDYRRPTMMGILMALSQLGLVGGPLLGGVLTEFASWRWCFYINLPVGAVAFVCLAFIELPDRKHKPELEETGTVKTTKAEFMKVIHALDLKGFVLFSGFAVMVVLALQWGGVDYAWDSATILGLIIGGVVLLLLFCWQEYRIGDRAMFPGSVVKRMPVWSSGITMFLFFGSQMIGNYYLPIYFQTVRNASPAMSGVYVLPTIFGTILMSLMSGMLTSKWGYYLPWMIVSGVLAGIGNGLLSMIGIHTPAAEWAWFQIITGLGRGAGMQMTIIAIQTNLPPAMVPVGQAFVVFQQTFGGAIFLAIGQTLFNSSLREALRKYAPTVNAETVIHAGASSIRDVVSGSDLTDVVLAFTESVNHQFYFAAALSTATAFTCLGMGWKRIAKKDIKQDAGTAEVEKTIRASSATSDAAKQEQHAVSSPE